MVKRLMESPACGFPSLHLSSACMAFFAGSLDGGMQVAQSGCVRFKNVWHISFAMRIVPAKAYQVHLIIRGDEVLSMSGSTEHRSEIRAAMGRRMATRLYSMWRNRCDYSPSFEFGSYTGKPETSHGVK